MSGGRDVDFGERMPLGSRSFKTTSGSTVVDQRLERYPLLPRAEIILTRSVSEEEVQKDEPPSQKDTKN